jgi:AmmeMemoRadiSam system protein A
VPLTERERRDLLDLARRAIAATVEGRAAPVVAGNELTAGLRGSRACFVTLWRGDELRGCIGQLLAREPLWEAVVNNASRAAVKDHRFTPVAADELGALRAEISVLTEAVPVEFGTPEELLERLRPGIDGVVLRIGTSVSTFLPQVWQDLRDKQEFMDHLSRKGGHASSAWRQAGVVVSVYQVEHFKET